MNKKDLAIHVLADKMAFPHGSFAIQPGMYLRDYFAAAALQSVLMIQVELAKAGNTTAVSLEDAAETCYEYADAMLAEREKKNEH